MPRPIVDSGGADAVATLFVDGGGAADVGTLNLDGGPAGVWEGKTRPAYRGSNRGMQGDPHLVLGPSGARLQFIGGQPLMDEGLENLVLISLFTNEGWCGNAFMKMGIGSDFVKACNQSITRQSLNQIRNAAERALVNPALGSVDVMVSNPSGYKISVRILIKPPAGSTQELILTKNGANWLAQRQTPAYLRVT